MPTTSPSGGVFDGDGVTGSEFDPSEAGEGSHDITYTFTDENDCSNEEVQTITVINCLGIDQNTDLGYKIYPNPTSKMLNIVFDNPVSMKLNITDMNGKLVFSSEIEEATFELDVSEWSRGIYTVVLVDQTNGSSHTQKVIVQ